MKELWIDGEYFVDLIDLAKRERALKIANIVVNQAYEVFKASSEGLPIAIIKSLYETSEAKRIIVQRSPLFPFTYSGEVVKVMANDL